MRHRERGRLSGYLRNVALNQVLLHNERWPFVLDTPLHADVTIGVDVKHHTAAFTVIGRNGADIHRKWWTTSQKEQLRTDQFKAYFKEMVHAECENHFMHRLSAIVIHRDGRAFPSEIAGAREGVRELISEGDLQSNASLTILEIAKTAAVPLRFFEVGRKADGRTSVQNPQIGTSYYLNDCDAYVCTTGRAFPRKGAVRPLHVRKVDGPLDLRDCLEDLFYLACLTWTNPKDCSRHPITIKLTDRLLNEMATPFDAEKLSLSRTPMTLDAIDDAGLYFGFHERIRDFAELVDGVLIHLKIGTSSRADPDRQRLSEILGQIGHADNTGRAVFRTFMSGNVRRWCGVADQLLSERPDETVVEQLEQLASDLERERTDSVALTRGSLR
ncbi:MAG: hypothetical protein IH991_08960 [Planctomycetes bacterium]|nr:hypothetical protein [Planctomycetota bacterium]